MREESTDSLGASNTGGSRFDVTSPAKAMKRSWSGGMIGCFSARVLRVIRLSCCSKITATT